MDITWKVGGGSVECFEITWNLFGRNLDGYHLEGRWSVLKLLGTCLEFGWMDIT